ncbi:hypothetical protein [Desulforhopalus singaporensis]|uniref:Uncharacterized protein n=1 Tax=Desulforhopalus singaporensis TaxID=91360 RepID=A0A1H0L959_9BACT|nr:hypothetical protein [Desulforhopalus singaporensis]SDO64655.1 hypothetical protein SAMN05660330_00707 [Desulforhopalus singaporensis]
MKLLQARTRGLHPVIQSRWFELSGKLNLFYFTDPAEGVRFFQALQTLNPPYCCDTVRPFADLAATTSWRGHKRKVVPAKRTVAIGIFDGGPGLARELGAISPPLYEIDRIEVGRRVDCSRWLNFVELASSVRWSSMAEEVQKLIEEIGPAAPETGATLHALTRNLRPGDRIKNQLADSLTALLTGLKNNCAENFSVDITALQESAMRHGHFQRAREIVYRRLPLLVYIDDSCLSARSGPPFLPRSDNDWCTLPGGHKASPIDRIKKMIDMGVRTSQRQNGGEPIFLLAPLDNSPDLLAPDELLDLIRTTAEKYQVLCLCSDQQFLEDIVAEKKYRDHQLMAS